MPLTDLPAEEQRVCGLVREEARRRLAAERPFSLYLVGSRATGEAGPTSDFVFVIDADEPLPGRIIKGCSQKLPAGWIHHVYLAVDLDFLEEHIPPNVEIHLMALPSWTSMPGMLWRHRPAEETACIARGADNYELGGGRPVGSPLGAVSRHVSRATRHH